jgi:hypothetical protein
MHLKLNTIYNQKSTIKNGQLHNFSTPILYSGLALTFYPQYALNIKGEAFQWWFPQGAATKLMSLSLTHIVS